MNIVKQHNRNSILQKVANIKSNLDKENSRGNGWLDLVMVSFLGFGIVYVGYHVILLIIRLWQQ